MVVSIHDFSFPYPHYCNSSWFPSYAISYHLTQKSFVCIRMNVSFRLDWFYIESRSFLDNNTYFFVCIPLPYKTTKHSLRVLYCFINKFNLLFQVFHQHLNRRFQLFVCPSSNPVGFIFHQNVWYRWSQFLIDICSFCKPCSAW